jgi:hypothetical protein
MAHPISSFATNVDTHPDADELTARLWPVVEDYEGCNIETVTIEEDGGETVTIYVVVTATDLVGLCHDLRERGLI